MFQTLLKLALHYKVGVTAEYFRLDSQGWDYCSRMCTAVLQLQGSLQIHSGVHHAAFAATLAFFSSASIVKDFGLSMGSPKARDHTPCTHEHDIQ